MTRLGAVVLVALAVAGIPSFITGAGTRFTPCPGAAGEACARIGGDGPPVRLAYVPGARTAVLPARLAVVFGASAETVPEVLRQAVLRVEAAADVPRALESLDRPAIVAGGPGDTGAVFAAARAPGVDGVVLVDPEGTARPPGPPLGVSMLLVAERPPPRALLASSVRPLVLLRRPGVSNDCTRRVLAGFARDPLAPARTSRTAAEARRPAGGAAAIMRRCRAPGPASGRCG
ncbi:MAG: hypothetical protein U0237_09210 [Thermoleophilia bacterium]